MLSPSPTRLLALLLACALPLGVVWGAMSGLESFRSWEDAREAENAGKVINGRVVQGGVVQTMERNLDANKPLVVILGNSLSNTDISVPALAKSLGIPRTQIHKLSVPNSIGVHWYAILKNRVYANGHKPKLVILLSDLQSALANAPRSEASRNNLLVHLDDREPLIDEKLGDRNYAFDRIRENRGKLRDKAITSVRDRMVGWLYHQRWDPAGKRPTEAAMSRVFDASKTDMRLHKQVIPIFNVQSKDDLLPFDPATLPAPEDSFFPETTQLIADNGGLAVFVRPPMSPQLPEGVGDIVLPQSEDATTRVVRRHGGVYLDMRALEMNGSQFHNVDHMNNEGAKHFTRILADVLHDLEEYRWADDARPTVNLLRVAEYADGVVTPRSLAIGMRQRPPAVLGKNNNKPVRQRRNAAFPTPALGFLSDNRVLSQTPYSSRCSPLRVLEDGRPLPKPNRSCEAVTKHRGGRLCHNDDRVLFSSTDLTTPTRNDREYKLVLAHNRSCDGLVWLYPGDRIRMPIDPADLTSFNRGATQIELATVDLGPTTDGAAADVSVTLRTGDRVRLHSEFQPPKTRVETALFSIEPRLSPFAQQASLEFHNDSDRFVAVTGAWLLGPRY